MRGMAPAFVIVTPLVPVALATATPIAMPVAMAVCVRSPSATALSSHPTRAGPFAPWPSSVPMRHMTLLSLVDQRRARRPGLFDQGLPGHQRIDATNTYSKVYTTVGQA